MPILVIIRAQIRLYENMHSLCILFLLGVVLDKTTYYPILLATIPGFHPASACRFVVTTSQYNFYKIYSQASSLVSPCRSFSSIATPR